MLQLSALLLPAFHFLLLNLLTNCYSSPYNHRSSETFLMVICHVRPHKPVPICYSSANIWRQGGCQNSRPLTFFCVSRSEQTSGARFIFLKYEAGRRALVALEKGSLCGVTCHVISIPEYPRTGWVYCPFSCLTQMRRRPETEDLCLKHPSSQTPRAAASAPCWLHLLSAPYQDLTQ